MLALLKMFVLVIIVEPLVLKKLPPEELVVRLTVVEPFVFGLLYWSCRCTVIVLDATPAVTVTAVVVNTSLLAAAGTTVSCCVALVSPLAAFVIVGLPATVSR